jgi:hypothetical protein
MSLVHFVFSWPILVACVTATVAGILLRSWKVELAGAVAALPFMFYLFENPAGRGAAPLLVCAHFGCVYALYRRKPLVATSLILPFIAVAVLLVVFGR